MFQFLEIKIKMNAPLVPLVLINQFLYSYRNLMVRLLEAVGVCLSTQLVEESQLLFDVSFIKADGPYSKMCVYTFSTQKVSVEDGSSFSSVINWQM